MNSHDSGDELTTKKINNVKVSAVRLPTDDRKIRGVELFPMLNANIFICAKKQSGKTMLIFKILKECANRDTNIVLCASTFNKDKMYLHMRKWFSKHFYVCYGDNNLSSLDALMANLKDETPDDESENEGGEKYTCPLKFDDDDATEEEKQQKAKFQAPEYIIVIDDMAKQCRSPCVCELMKIHRHFSSKVIISSQYIKDLSPEQIMQLDYVILFGNHTEEKLKHLFDMLDLSIEFEQFLKLYHDATSAKYNFLYIDRNNNKFRKNFDEEYQL